ncbi:uncharacterized protein LOC118756154, partial [Rhagoletis pomonella]|uniref:uncharacterized protein LOC118756152 n=1 Tax=Rhagoletis pomonella TaxID=28610 RepID=UPI00177D1AFF
ITEHWCTCVAYETVRTSDATAKIVTKLVIQEINQYLEDKNISSKCSPLTLKSLKKVDKKLFDLPNRSTYRLDFTAKPKDPQFQATADYDIISKTITINVEEISRQNKYEGMSDCIDLKEAKKFCICTDKS